MVLFKTIVTAARQKFKLGEATDGLLAIIVSMIADPENGGFRGFLESFNKAGLGHLAESWVAEEAGQKLSIEQTEKVFGEVTLTEVAEEVGLDYKTTISATAFMTPLIVNELTPRAEIPIDSDLNEMINGAQPTGDRSSTATEPVPGDETLNLIIPLVLFLVLAAIAVMVVAGPSVKAPVTDKKPAVNSTAK